MDRPASAENPPAKDKSASKRETLGGSVALFLRLWNYSGLLQPPTGLPLAQDAEIPELIRDIIRDSKGAIADWQPELLSARFDDALHAISAAKGLQRRFLTFHRKTEPQQVVPSILIYNANYQAGSAHDTAAPQDMLANVTSAQILISETIYEAVKGVPGFQFNPKPVREAGETFGPEAIYELLWTDESTYGHLRQVSHTGLDKVRRYQVQEELGRGAMGAVYKAYDRLIGRTVALKTISINRANPDRDELIERLKQEAKAAGGLDHPNIITIYDVGQEDDIVYLSMQFVEGKTLLKFLAEGGVPSLTTLISWADQISSAVGFAHSHGVIHRDLKPANLMLTNQGSIKILDFGIAKIENTTLTQTGLVVGTPSYMAPEQLEGKKIDHRADIFALGSVFYELVTREKAFKGDVASILYKIMHEDPVAPSLINPAIPGGIDAIIRKALAKNPEERFQTCEEMRNAFLEQAALLHLKQTNAPGVAAVPKTAPSASAEIPNFLREYAAPEESRRIWPSLAFGLALALVVTVGWAFYKKPQVRAFAAEAKARLRMFQGTSPQSNTVKAPDAASQRPPARVSDQDGANTAAASEITNKVSELPPADPVASQVSTTLPRDSDEGQSSGQPADNIPYSSAVATSASSASGPTPAQTAGTDQPAIAQSAATVQQTEHINPSPSPSGSSSNSPAASGDSAKNDLASSSDENQTAGSTSTKPAKKLRPRAGSSVDGFRRQDIPELLRQADAALGRGDYRLANYEYNLILKLDSGNTVARTGLYRVQVAEHLH